MTPDPAFLARLTTLEQRGTSILADFAVNSALLGDFGDDTAVNATGPIEILLDEMNRLLDVLPRASAENPCFECAPQAFAAGYGGFAIHPKYLVATRRRRG